MNFISIVRKNGKFLVFTLAFALLFFILSQGIQGLMPLLNRAPKYYVGEVAGDKIELRYFDAILNHFKVNFSRNQSAPLNESDMKMARELVWRNIVNQKIQEKIISKEHKTIGLLVTEEELIDMVQGKHIHESIKRTFVDSVGNFDKKILLKYLQDLNLKSENDQIQWSQFENNLRNQRLDQKYVNLISLSTYLTDIEYTNIMYMDQNEIDIKYLWIPYDNIENKQITISDSMIKEYYNIHKKEFERENTKDIVYIQYIIKPSDEDLEEYNNDIIEIRNGFEKATDDIEYAKTHTDGDEMEVFRSMPYSEIVKFFPKRSQRKKGVVSEPITDEDHITKIYKISKINRNKGNFYYEVAIIEKNLISGDKTREELYRKADLFAHKIKNAKDFEKSALEEINENKKSHLVSVQTVNDVKKADENINGMFDTKKIVKWAHNKNNKSEISPVFELKDKIIVACKIADHPAGIAKLDDVRDEIKKKIYKKEKAKYIVDKIEKTEFSSVNSLSKLVDIKNELSTHKKLRFKNDDIGNIKNVLKSIGTAFSLKKKGDITPPIIEDKGVLVIELVDIYPPKENINPGIREVELKSIQMNEQDRIASIFNKEAKIVDNRSEYY